MRSIRSYQSGRQEWTEQDVDLHWTRTADLLSEIAEKGGDKEFFIDWGQLESRGCGKHTVYGQ